MKTHILRFRAINRDTFEALKSGEKKVETRAGSPKYQKVKEGDALKLVCGKKHFIRSVKEVKRFKTITSLLKEYKPSEINPNLKTKNETMDMYYSYPDYRTKIKKFGLIAFKLQ